MNDERREDRDGKPQGEGSFAEMLEQSFSAQGETPIGEKVQGRVFNIGKEYVFLDLGTRDEGILPRAEVEHDGKLDVAEGDVIDVMTLRFQDGAVRCASRLGAAGASERSGDAEAALMAIRDALESEMPVEGNVKEVVKAGFSINIMGQRAFCPISQIDAAYCEVPEEHLGHTYSFLVLEADDRGRNIVVSRRRLLEAEAAELAKQTWEQIREGETYDGVVKNILSYGAFVDIGGIEGLLHVSEISHDRVDDPSDVLQKGQKVRVVLKGIDRDKQRVALSMRMLEEDPWIEAAREIREGQVIEGEVVRIAQFGAFVEVRRGVEGLVHISEMGGGRRLKTPREAVGVGQQVSVKVLSVDPEARRISLSLDEAANERAETEEVERKREFKARSKPNQSLGTLGDILGKHLKK